MSDWAKRNETRLIALDSQREQTDARSEQDKVHLKLRAPRLWQYLRDRLKTNCEALNAETATSTLELQLLSGAKIQGLTVLPCLLWKSIKILSESGIPTEWAPANVRLGYRRSAFSGAVSHCNARCQPSIGNEQSDIGLQRFAATAAS